MRPRNLKLKTVILAGSLAALAAAIVSCGKERRPIPVEPRSFVYTPTERPTPESCVRPPASSTPTLTATPASDIIIVPTLNLTFYPTGVATVGPYCTPTPCPDRFELGFEKILPAFSCPPPDSTAPHEPSKPTPTPITFDFDSWSAGKALIITSLEEFYQHYPRCEPVYRPYSRPHEYKTIDFDEQVLVVYVTGYGSSMCPVWVDGVVAECGEVRVHVCQSWICMCAFGSTSTYNLVDKVDLPYRFAGCPSDMYFAL